jgi:hypothetical protein
VEKLYCEQKPGEDLRLPSGYKAKMDTNIILDQLQIYRDQGIATEPNVQDAERREHSTEGGKPTVVTSQSEVLTRRKGFAFKLAESSPYNFFLTAICDSPPTHKEALSISFYELLDPTLGDLDSSLQINFMVELDWLMEMYKVYGHE